MRVISLLSAYYVSELPQAIQDDVARPWMIELQVYPEWAIDAAMQWWGGRENKKRRNKPMWGDIAERCEAEMIWVRLGEKKLKQYEKHGDSPPDFMR